MSYGSRQTDADDPFAETRMSFGDHIEELRWHLIRAILGFCVALVVSLFLGEYVLRMISAPVEEALGAVYDRRAKKIIEDYKLKHPDSEKTEGKIEVKAQDLIAFLKKIGVVIQPGEVGPDEFVTLVTRSQPGEDLVQFAKLNSIIGQRPTLKVFNVIEGFMVWFKVCIVTGFVLASPWVFYQIWSFIAAGLYPHEKRYVNRILPFSILLFMLGVFVCQYFVIPASLKFLLGFSTDLNVDPDLRLNEWLSFAIWVPVLFGLAFQTPLVMLFLERIGIGTVDGFRRWRKVSWFVMILAAAFITPTPDPYTFLLLGVPMVLLYELGIWLCIWSPRDTGLDADVPQSEEMVEV